MRTRPRTAVLIAAVTPALLVSGVSPAAALSEQAAAAKAVAGRMFAAPRSEALVQHLPVRVVVRVPARTRRLRVRLGGRDVTARFRRSRGSLRVAHLTRRDGLRYGHNHLVVLAERRDARPVMDARPFVLARRDADLVRLRVRTGPVTSLNLRVAGGIRLAPGHFGRPGAVARRLAVIRRERTARVWLNGRRVTRALDRSQPTRWTASLSATQGLRYGVNRLRLLVAEPDRGRYRLLRRRFLVRRNHHLAAAGWDTATRIGGRVRLDGRRSRTIRGGRPDHSWRIVSKPRGSRAKLRRRGSARPLLTPDRRGRYVVGLTVRARTRRAAASQTTGPSTDTVEVTAGPASLLLPFEGLTVKDGHPGILVGDTFYPNPSPTGSAMQWLTLDRKTLTPIDPVTGAPSTTGNNWLDGTRSGDHGVGTLASALSSQDIDQLVILTFPYPRGGPGPPVQQDQIAAFNDAMKALGVDPIPASILQDHNKLAIVGVPSGGPGSGRYTHGGGPVDALTGWLMPDAVKDGDAFRFRLQPERPAFDTSSSHTGTTNTMTVRDERLDAVLPDGARENPGLRATGGFQVVKLDPIDFTPVDRAVFATNYFNEEKNGYGYVAALQGLEAMAKFLNDDGSRPHVAVQSIGHVVPNSLPHSPYERDQGLDAWHKVASALAAYGANPHIFNTAGGSYAFLGGSWLAKSEVADSSPAVALNPATNESGTLRGRVSMRADGYWMPAAADPSDSLEFPLYDQVFRSPTPWPYTAGGAFPQQENCRPRGDDVDAYAAALSYIAKGIGLPDKFSSNLRTAYVERDQFTWSDEKVDLLALQYQPGQGFDPGEFCNLKAELQQEFDWLDNVKTPFDAYKKALGSSGNLQLADLYQLGQRIQIAVAPDDSAEVGWSSGAFFGNMMSAAILAFLPEDTPVLAAWEAIVVVYELVRELVSGKSGAPAGDQVSSTVQSLVLEVATRISNAADGLDRLRDVIISDYGRLQAVGSAGLNIDPATTKNNITAAANAFFSSELVPIPYGVYAMFDSNGPVFNIDNCDDLTLNTWRGVPGSAQLKWMGDFNRDGYQGQYPTLFALGLHSLRGGAVYPPKEVTDPMFNPVKKGGYGMQPSRFFWEQYHKGFPPTDIFKCIYD